MPRRRWCWTPLAAWSRLRKRPQTEDDALPHPRRLLGGPVTAGQASPSLGRQLAAPGRGRGRLLHRHSARGTAARTLSRDPGSAQAANQPAGSDRAHSLPGPRLRAGRRDHAGEPGHAATLPGRGRSAPKPFCLQTPECQLFRDRQRSLVSQASRAATRSPTGTLAQPGSRGKGGGVASEHVARSNDVYGVHGRVRQDARRRQPKHQRNCGLGQRHSGRLKPASPPRSRPHRLARLAGLVRANVARPGATRNCTHEATIGQHQATPLVDRCGPAGTGPRWRG
jgi:hypothetical protein